MNITVKPHSKVIVKTAETPADIEAVQGLMRAMVDWLFVRHDSYRDLVARYFDPAAFEHELAALPGEFAAPNGVLLIATVEGEYAGCVGLRSLDSTTCEMKRMYVDPQFHGLGIGEALARRLIERATDLGFDRLCLDTGPKQFEARGLYQKLNFKETGPYTVVSDEMADWLTFMARDLTRDRNVLGSKDDPELQ